jgi:hypothetical protein
LPGNGSSLHSDSLVQPIADATQPGRL